MLSGFYPAALAVKGFMPSTVERVISFFLKVRPDEPPRKPSKKSREHAVYLLSPHCRIEFRQAIDNVHSHPA